MSLIKIQAVIRGYFSKLMILYFFIFIALMFSSYCLVDCLLEHEWIKSNQF